MFICVEGLDNCGKSTLIENYILSLGNRNKRLGRIVTTAEPINKKLKNLIEKEGDDHYKHFELFEEDRKKHIEDVIRPALEDEKIIICDRYFYSSLVYNLSTDLHTFEYYKAVTSYMSKLIHDEFFILPALTIFIIDDYSSSKSKNVNCKHLKKNFDLYYWRYCFLAQICCDLFPNSNTIIRTAKNQYPKLLKDFKKLISMPYL